MPTVTASTQPATRGSHRVDWLLGGAIAARNIYGLATLPLIPLLIVSDPLLLTVLSGSTVAEVFLGAQVRAGAVPWWLAVVAGAPAWVLTDWLYWAAGRRWGDRALVRLIRRRDPAHAIERARRVERVAHRLGPVSVLVVNFLPVPGPLVYAAAGTGGMRLPLFLVLSALGQLLFSATMVGLGYALGGRAIALVHQAQQYAVALTLGVVAVLVVGLLLRRWRQRRCGRGPVS